MSDQTPPPPPEQPPRPRPRPPQQARRRPIPPPRSTESRFIGYLVLGFGFVAVIAVLLLAFMGGKPDGGMTQPDAQQTKQISTNMENRITAPAPVVAKPEVELHFKRQPDFKAGQMDGNWQAMIGDRYTAVLQMNGGVYQVILATSMPTMPRNYSSGQYTVLEDMITFNPRLDWPKPATKNDAVSYQRMTSAPFTMISAFSDGKMLWQNVPPGEKRVRRLSSSPLFMGQALDYIVWQKMN